MGERRTPNTTCHYPALRSPAPVYAQQLSAAPLPGLLCASLRGAAAIRRGTPDTTRGSCRRLQPSRSPPMLSLRAGSRAEDPQHAARGTQPATQQRDTPASCAGDGPRREPTAVRTALHTPACTLCARAVHLLCRPRPSPFLTSLPTALTTYLCVHCTGDAVTVHEAARDGQRGERGHLPAHHLRPAQELPPHPRARGPALPRLRPAHLPRSPHHAAAPPTQPACHRSLPPSPHHQRCLPFPLPAPPSPPFRSPRHPTPLPRQACPPP